ncbi:MAG: hypothetical protein RIB59_08595 [Rhodospirillales bacterium]
MSDDDGTMTNDGFKRLMRCIEAYGAEPARWPEAERDGLLALLAESPEAQRALEGAREFDALLDRAAPPMPSPELTADILAGAAPSPVRQWFSLLWPFGPVWQPVSAFALAAVLGFYLGTVTPAPASQGADLSAGEMDSPAAGPSQIMEAL